MSVKADLDTIANRIALPLAKATVYAAFLVYALLALTGMGAIVWALWKITQALV